MKTRTESTLGQDFNVALKDAGTALYLLTLFFVSLPALALVNLDRQR